MQIKAVEAAGFCPAAILRTGVFQMSLFCSCRYADNPVQPRYAADGHSPLVVKHADTKSKLWKTAVMVFVSACFTTTGRGVDELNGGMGRVPEG